MSLRIVKIFKSTRVEATKEKIGHYIMEDNGFGHLHGFGQYTSDGEQIVVGIIELEDGTLTDLPLSFFKFLRPYNIYEDC